MMMMEFDLKEVFSILDENNEGQIQLRRFVDVANNYYSDAEVSSLELRRERQLFVRRVREDQYDYSLPVRASIRSSEHVPRIEILDVCRITFLEQRSWSYLRFLLCQQSLSWGQYWCLPVLFLAISSHHQSIGSEEYWFNQFWSILWRDRPNQFIARRFIEGRRIRSLAHQPRKFSRRRFWSTKLGKRQPSISFASHLDRLDARRKYHDIQRIRRGKWRSLSTSTAEAISKQ